MIDYKEIFEAWKISFNPSVEQEKLAQERLQICLGCNYRKEVLKGVKWSAYCADCGCPLNKKVFSNFYNPCTQKKWEIVDQNYIDLLPTKDNKSII
jgi:hypothetical protein